MNRTLEESGATFAVGIISAVNAATGWARVRLPAYDNLETAELPVLQRRTHRDKALDLPDVGEQVALILDRRGEDGVVLGAIWSEADPVPQSDGPDVDVRRYEDGTLLRYDRKAHKLTAEVRGSVDIVADGVVRVESKTRLELAAPPRLTYRPTRSPCPAIPAARPERRAQRGPPCAACFTSSTATSLPTAFHWSTISIMALKPAAGSRGNPWLPNSVS